MKVSFDVNVGKLNSKERQYDHFLRIMKSKEKDVSVTDLSPSEKY